LSASKEKSKNLLIESKDFEPVYVLENQIEIDFYLNNKVLVEVKLEEDIRDKQRELFEKFKAKHKQVIRGFEDLDELESLLGKS
jgi:F0F1-type ATP synthase alpha subunit